MRDIVKVVMMVVVMGVFISGAAYAEYNTAASSADQGKTTVIDEGNKICPVSGDKVDGKDFYDYNGKHYGLCCSMCAAAFEADPKKYSAIADKEVAGK
jgi:YHS domain-containing protein